MNTTEYHDIVVDCNGDQWNITTTPDGFYTTRRGEQWFANRQGFGDEHAVIAYIEQQTGFPIHRYCTTQTTDGSAGWLPNPGAPAHWEHPTAAYVVDSIPSHPTPDDEDLPF